MKRLVLAALLSGLAAPCFAQSIGGAASLTAGVSSSRVALPASITAYSSLRIMPAVAATQEAFYQLGGPSVVATTSSPAVPARGICLQVGPNNFFAAITASGSATLRLTQLTTCTPR